MTPALETGLRAPPQYRPTFYSAVSTCIAICEEKKRTYGTALAKGDAALVIDSRLPDPRLDSEADLVGSVLGPALLVALVIVLAVDADAVGGGSASESGGGDDEGGKLHFGGVLLLRKGGLMLVRL